MSVTLGDVILESPDGKDVVSLDQHQTVGDAMRILAQNGILSAPVMTYAAKSECKDTSDCPHDDQQDSNSNRMIGWIDINEITSACLKSIHDKLSGKNMLRMMAVLEQEGPAFAEKQLSSIVGLLEAGASALATVDINEPTLSALTFLVQGGRSAVAVLSPDGALVTNLSTSDLRFLQPNHFGVLALPVGEFLGLLHDAVYVGARAVDGDLRRSSSNLPASPSASGTTSTPRSPSHHNQFFAERPGRPQGVPFITCGKGTSVAEAMRMMVSEHVHRVYIVSEDLPEIPKPIAVVTIGEMIHFLSEHVLTSDSTNTPEAQ